MRVRLQASREQRKCKSDAELRKLKLESAMCAGKTEKVGKERRVRSGKEREIYPAEP